MFQSHVPEHRLSRLAVWSAVLVAALVVLAGAVFAVAYAVGGADATADNWVGVLGVLGLFGGLAWSFIAFGLAIFARSREGAWAPLWLPLSLFPALVVFVVLSEAFWWE